ncbi:MAG: phosphate signaling complex protein PhoU [Chloroflexales bacterium]|nr:phosphate signaling complex protein PhoU [Chloroflexales bacterium]
MIRERYARQIAGLREELLRQGSMVEHALQRAMTSLETWDVTLAAQIIREDADIDAAQRVLEEKVIDLMATQQPIVASDLRLMSVVVAIASELERIGDYANSIARRIKRVTRRPAFVSPPSGIREMATLARQMLHTSLEAFLHQDTSLAYSLAQDDERVDELEEILRAELINIAQSDPRRIEAALDLMEVIQVLERVADRATNIGERVIYLVTCLSEELNP